MKKIMLLAIVAGGIFTMDGPASAQGIDWISAVMVRDAIAIMTALVIGTTTAAVTGTGSSTAIVESAGTIALTTRDFGRLMGARTGGRFKMVSENRTGATEPELRAQRRCPRSRRRRPIVTLAIRSPVSSMAARSIRARARPPCRAAIPVEQSLSRADRRRRTGDREGCCHVRHNERPNAEEGQTGLKRLRRSSVDQNPSALLSWPSRRRHLLSANNPK